MHIEPLASERTEDAVHLLAQAFVSNPLHVAAFGPSNVETNEAFFRMGLSVMKGPKLVATEDSRILGVVHWVHAPRRQFPPLQKLRMMPTMIGALGALHALRISAWLSAWAAHDPTTPHSHLGPIGVAPDARGRRIGHALMERYCEDADRHRLDGYLETDRAENVAFYQRFGFETLVTAPVLGVTNYFMRRDARG
jgi:GNAT superfamily N-acetyltransferase